LEVWFAFRKKFCKVNWKYILEVWFAFRKKFCKVNWRYILEAWFMANKKAEVKSKKRTLYLKEDLYEKFAEILKKNGRTPSEVFNKYMEKVMLNFKDVK
jgi:hypothetical protein